MLSLPQSLRAGVADGRPAEVILDYWPALEATARHDADDLAAALGDAARIDPAALGRVVARRVIIDARCCLDAGLWRDAGWTVRVLGRP